MKIKTFFIVSISVGSLVGLISSGLLLESAVSRYQAADRSADFSQSVALLTQVSEKVALERGEENAALQTDNAADSQRLATIADRIDGSRKASAAAIAQLTRLGDGPGAEVLAVISAKLKQLDEVRSNVGAALKLPKADRDPKLLQTFAPTMVGILDAMDGSLDKLEIQVAAASPDIDNYLSIARLTASLRSVAGNRSSQITGLATAGQAASQPILENFIRSGGIVVNLWQNIRQGVLMTGNPPRLVDAMALVDKGFTKPSEELYGKMMPGMRGEAAYAMPVVEFRKQILPMLATIQTLRDASFDMAQSLADQAKDQAVWKLLAAIALVAVTAVAGVVSATLFTRRVLSPLADVTGVVGEIASGRLDLSVPGLDRGDELGHLANAVETLRSAAQQANHLKAETERQQADRQNHAIRVEELCGGFDQESGSLIEAMSSSASDALQQAHVTGSMAQDARQRSAEAASAADEASSSVQTVAAAAEQMAASIHEISSRVSSAAQVASRAVEETRDATHQMTGLAEASTRIGDIVRLIQDVAGQTNLLALNATIEAARAGEAGKGFAVVAGEVKALATQTARATGEISAQINQIQNMTHQAVVAIEDVGRTIDQMSDIATAIAAAVEEQGAATSEIARNVHLAADRTTQVSETVTSVAHVMDQAERASANMVDSMEGMGCRAQELTGRVNSFLGTMRNL